MIGRYDTPVEPAQRKRILVVDDEPANVRLMTAYLKCDGYEVLAALSGAEALAKLAAGDVSLVLLDIRMPQMDGFEVCRRLRQDRRNARVPVIFLTAEANDAESELTGLEVGADEYLLKPVSRRALAARVRNLLRLADAEHERHLITQLAHAEKLAAIGQIAAGVAHEINNPLAFMLSNLGSLHTYLEDIERVVETYHRDPAAARRLEEELDVRSAFAELSAIVRETAEGGRRVRDIVQGLKTFSRLEDSRLEPVDLAEVAGNTLLLTERELSGRARVVKDIQPAPVAAAPRAQLHQVTLNLLVNALQALESATPGAHEIRVRTGCDGAHALLEVSDTGCGMAPEVQARIFDPYFTTKEIGVGAGMGLSVCAAVVHKLHGEIQVRSTVGAGSTFTVRIPTDGPTPMPS